MFGERMYRCRWTVGNVGDKDEKVSGSGNGANLINWISCVY